MKSRIKKKKLIRMIHSGVTDFSKEDIKAFIRTELEKDESEIDTDYVDMLTKLLVIKQHEQPKKKTYYKKPLRALIAAAVIIVLLVSALTVSAQVFNFNIPQKVAQLISGNAEIDFNLENADTIADGYALTETDLAKRLAEFGISPVTFPEELIKENCKINIIENQTQNEIWEHTASIEFEYQNKFGDITITQYENDFIWNGATVLENVISGQLISANGLDVLVIEQESSCNIEYKDNLIKYDIYLECDISTALAFAESIK